MPIRAFHAKVLELEQAVHESRQGRNLSLPETQARLDRLQKQTETLMQQAYDAAYKITAKRKLNRADQRLLAIYDAAGARYVNLATGRYRMH